MKNISQIVRVLAAVLIGATLISTLAHAQQTNPNRLRPCPKPDYSKNSDIGIGFGTEKWTNCWGVVTVRGMVLEGEWVNGNLNGQGTTTFPNGEKYVGEYKDGKYQGQGIVTFASGEKYVGEFKDGMQKGQGTHTFASGEKYVGEWNNGKRNGLGINYFSDGRIEEGIWTDGKFIREAKVNLPNLNNNIATNTDRTDIDRERQQTNPKKLPSCPKPDYSKNSDIGIGGRTEKWTNCWGRYTVEFATKHKGDVLEGEWLNGLLNGQGTYYYLANNQYKGDKHVGEYKDGKKNGQGTYYFLADNQSKGGKYVGEFKDDNPNGQGTYTWVNGDKHVGEYKDGKKNGQGTYYFLANTQFKGDKYVGEFKDEKKHGQGTYTFASGDKYVGEFKDEKKHGQGTYTFANGNKYVGEFKDDKYHGQGIGTTADGKRFEGIWENNNFIREAKVNLPALNNNTATNTDRTDIDRERQQLAEERRRLEEDKRQREQAKSSQRINLQVTHTQPTSDGSFFIEVKTNADTSSLQIDGKEEGGKADGNYIIKRVARAGSASSFRIVATDVYGNTDTKSITVSRTIVDSKITYAALNPGQVKQQTTRDAVAIIIGIADYKSLPKADFANDDARAFYDYAIRALGIKPENIKLLVDSDAEEVEILRTFRNWLPSKVRSTTDVYVFYSGHGLPTADGQGLYLIPPRAARDLIDDTAIPFSKINAALQSAKPKSVTMILDACYSGQARSGETLVASARPVRLKTENRLFPENFTVITASQNDQISSSNPDLQHGIFSYYLMKGMEGDADANRDGKITLGEMQAYLVENVGRQAGMMNRKQEPQLVGDANRVLVGR